MKDVILRNARAEQYVCAARKNFIMKNGVISESESKTLICHFSDIHSDLERYENVIDIINYYKPDFAVHTGDTVTWDMQDDYKFLFEGFDRMNAPCYNVIGNHDTYTGEKSLKNTYLHNELIKPLKGITASDEGYYFVDFEKNNIRLIALNNYENDDVEYFGNRHYCILEKQCNWLIEVLRGAQEKNLSVIIISHESDELITPAGNNSGFCQRMEPYPWGLPLKKPHIVADIVNVFRHGGELKSDYVWETDGPKVHIECSFSGGGDFICYLNGHRHGDYIGYLPSYKDQLSCCVTCSGCFPKDYHNIGNEVSDLARIPGTISEDALNMYVIDREKRTISAVRIGAYVNDLFEERIVAVFKY